MTGRPSIYTAELASRICVRLAEGEPLRVICRDPEMPADSTVRMWVVEDREGFAAQYARAREAQMHHYAEEIIEISDTPVKAEKVTTKPDGSVERVVGDAVDRARLQVDARRWLMGKLAGRYYGDKVTQQHEGTVTLLDLVKQSMTPKESGE